MVIPSALAIALFVLAAYGLFLPAFKTSILERKKDMLRQLTRSAQSVLREAYRAEQRGEKSRSEAQAEAIATIRSLRYGDEGKDYFWIHDTRPSMIMHPYRTELEGKDLSGFADPEGKRLFVEMVRVVDREGGNGFTPYLWQWKDDPGRVVPKLSHVRLFEPWGWIIGSGVYLNDVRAEVSSITRALTYASAAILCCIALISGYIVRQGIRTAERRRLAEQKLEAYRLHLEELVEQRTEALAKANAQLQAKIDELEAAERAREQLIAELKQALAKVKTLSGLLPICASCKKIRDDRGYWNKLEVYIEQYSEAEFSHGLCPDCVCRLYPSSTVR